MAATPEAKVKAKIDAMLKSKGPRVWFFKPASGAFGKSGIPDYIICVVGVFLAIEAKASEKNKPTAMQERQMQYIRSSGGIPYVVYDKKTLGVVARHIDKILAAV